MKKKKILNSIILVLFVIALIYFVYNLFFAITTGKHRVDINLNKEYYIGADINATLKVYDMEKYYHTSKETLESKVKITLYDSNHKKVKKIKQTFEAEEGEELNANLAIPEDLEPGVYYLKFNVSTAKGFDSFEKQIIITDSFNNDLVISLDKGIYKPGDEVKFRGMLLSKKDNTPISSEVNISIYDGNSNRVYSEDVKTSEYGIISGNFNLASEVNSGMYKIVFSLDNQEFAKQFKVNPYITPKFEVGVSLDKVVYKIEEKSVITVDSKYFFGEPVVNADVQITINDETKVGITNSEGKYELEYIPNEKGVYPIKVSVTDESNYMIESNSTLFCSDEIFNIELLPEYGKIIDGIDNNIYIFTTNLDKTPLKTYTTITVGNLIKQVLVDENGVGVLTLTSSDLKSIPKIDKKILFNVESKNMNEETIDLEFKLDFEQNYGIIVGTDKVKYNQGEDITVKLNSSLDKTENTIYVCKNSRIIKTVTTDEEEFKINLEDEQGLINIYSVGKSNKLENKKTIFIMPEKSLDITLETNQEEYLPGDELKLQMELKDENGNSVDGAVLVSILDEAVLSLAENDLNIDNLMLALQDIEFNEDVDLASIYATILDSKNESILMGMLLKQSTEIPELNNSNNYNNNREYEQNARLWFMIVLISALIYVVFKSKAIRGFVLNTILLIFTFSICNIAFYWIFESILDFNSEELILIINLIISIIIYKKIILNSKSIFLKNIIEFVLLPVILWIDMGLVYYLDNDFNIISFIIVTLIISISIGVLVVLNRKFRDSKKDEKFLVKVIVSAILPIIFAIFDYGITGFDFYDIFDNIPTCVVLNLIIGMMFAVYQIKNSPKDIAEKSTEQKEFKIVINVQSALVILVVVILIGIVIINNVIGNFAGTTLGEIDDDVYYYRYDDYSVSNDSSSISNDDYLNPSMIRPMDSSSASKSIGFDIGLPSVFSANNTSDSVQNIESSQEVLEYSEEKQVSEDDNIRNIFLESLCFMPEVITENGKAEETIKLSDNITTWQIQTVANTKDGRLGYANGTIKVFKDFFVDFSLPTNSVVGDKISIPVTVYNYTENSLIVDLAVKTENWFKLGEFNSQVSVESQSIALVYVPIEILSAGNNIFRVEGKSGDVSDIIQLSMETKPNGVKVSKVLNNGAFEDEINLDVIYMQDVIENTRDLKIKLYPTTMTTVIEGLDSIFKLPTGCFEQTSSTLYPNIVALRYMEENEIINEELKAKALEYISSGYQRLLTFEVTGKKGGYSLYGKNPAETVLTAYGLMELKDLTTVYDVDENVLENMKNFLFDNQNLNGTFKMQGDSNYSTSHVVGKCDEYALNAYVIWALSEAYPDDGRLEKSIKYLEDNLDEISDNYTLALVANVFANTDNKNTDKVIKRLMNNIDSNEIKSNTMDYWGTRGSVQNVQATALTSLALSKTNSNSKTNEALVEKIISKRANNGTWGSTQATILALKALNEYSMKTKVAEQEIKVTLNDVVETINVSKNSLDLYELEFDDVSKENKLNIDIEKGQIYYEIIQEYYVTYEEFSKNQNDLIIESNINTEANVNNTVIHNIKVTNTSDSEIYNGMVEISIPQGFSVKEESLSKLEANKLIERYEYNYSSIYLYLRDFEIDEIIDLSVEYNPNYPEAITGGMIRVYDYYNPDIEAYSLPVTINVK